jgi:transposase
MQYSMTATVKAMKIQEVILRATSKQILWTEAADIIGVSYRTMKRWKTRYQTHGYGGIFDRRMEGPSPKRVPMQELETILNLYRTTYRGFNVTHFHEKLREHHDITRGYTFIKCALQTAGLVGKSKTRGKHRKRRPRKSLVGMMLHLDGSTHEWIPGLPGVFFDLLVLMDDATGEIYQMLLVDEESTLTCMQILKDCVARHGIFCSLYSDRAGHFFFTPKAGGKVLEGHLTQIGRSLTELGIRPIPAYSPQARGRGERINETLQGRLPNEFRLHGIKTKDAANLFLQQIYIRQFNRRFAVKAEQPGSAFVPVQPHIDLDLVFSVTEDRTVGHDNTITFERLILQIEPSHLRVSFAKCRVLVHQHLNQTLSITFGPHLLGRYNAQGKILKNSLRSAA